MSDTDPNWDRHHYSQVARFTCENESMTVNLGVLPSYCPFCGSTLGDN